jgi:hypothetical protein
MGAMMEVAKQNDLFRAFECVGTNKTLKELSKEYKIKYNSLFTAYNDWLICKESKRILKILKSKKEKRFRLEPSLFIENNKIFRELEINGEIKLSFIETSKGRIIVLEVI